MSRIPPAPPARFPDALAAMLHEECRAQAAACAAADLVHGIEDVAQILGRHPVMEEWMAMTLQVVRALREPRLSRALVCRFAGCVSAPSVIASLTEAPVTAAMLWMLRRRVVTAHERAGEASGPWLRVRAADLSGRGLSDHELTAAAFLRRILETFAPVFDGTAGRGAWDLRELGPRPSSRWARGYAADCLDRLGSARGWTDRPALLAA